MKQTVYSVTEYGALADGKTLATAAIQRTIDACAAAGGGVVLIPDGTFLFGTIWLRSHVELRLSSGAVLLASPDLDDYNTEDAYPQNWGCPNEQWNASHLIIAHEVEDVAITGTGVIDGNGTVFFEEPDYGLADGTPANAWRYYTWAEGFALAKDKTRLRPGQAIAVIESRDVRLEDFTVRNVTCWACFLYGCDNVTVRGLRIKNPPYFVNTDGVDVDSCAHVTVFDCEIDTGDDAIAVRGSNARLKNNRKICEDVTVKNCRLASSSSAVRVGVGVGDIDGLTLSDLIITRGAVGVNLQGNWANGSTGIHHVTVRRVTASGLAYPLTVSAGKYKTIDHITVEDFTAHACATLALSAAVPGNVSDVTLRRVSVCLKERPLGVPYTPAILAERGNAMLEANGVTRLSLDSVALTADPETAAAWADTARFSKCPGLSVQGLTFSEI